MEKKIVRSFQVGGVALNIIETQALRNAIHPVTKVEYKPTVYLIDTEGWNLKKLSEVLGEASCVSLLTTQIRNAGTAATRIASNDTDDTVNMDLVEDYLKRFITDEAGVSIKELRATFLRLATELDTLNQKLDPDDLSNPYRNLTDYERARMRELRPQINEARNAIAAYDRRKKEQADAAEAAANAKAEQG